MILTPPRPRPSPHPCMASAVVDPGVFLDLGPHGLSIFFLQNFVSGYTLPTGPAQLCSWPGQLFFTHSDTVRNNRSTMEMDIEYLRSSNAELQSNLERAAEIGKSLLEENDDLKNQLEKMISDSSKQSEEAEQERYSLQQKIDRMNDMDKWYKVEIAQQKHDLANQGESQLEAVGAEKYKVKKLTRQVRELQAELGQSNNLVEQLRHQISQLEPLLEPSHVVDITANDSQSDDTAEILAQLASIQDENKNLQRQYIETSTELERRRVETDVLKQRLGAKDEEIEEAQCEASSYAVSLDRVRSEVQDLKAEIDVMRDTSSNHGNKGNSLFSEVEDRRIKAEQKLISLKHRSESLEIINKRNTAEKQKMRMQMMVLLQMSRGEADGDRVHHLETQLSKSRSKNRHLTEQIYTLGQKFTSQASELTERFSAMETSGEGSDKAFTNYLTSMVKTKQEELQNLGSQLRDADLQLLETRNEKSKLERKLYSAESEREKVRNKLIQVQLKNDELLMKYDPESVKTNDMAKRRYIKEKIVVDDVMERTVTSSCPSLDSTAVQSGSKNTTLSSVSNTTLSNKSLSTKSNEKIPPVVSDENTPPSNENTTVDLFDILTAHLPKKGVSCTKVRSVSFDDNVTGVNCDGNVESSQLSSHGERESKGKKELPKPKGQRMTKVIKNNCETVDMVDDCKAQ